MVFLETSVFLASVLAEERCPPDELFRRPLTASRLIEFETRVRLHARGLDHIHGATARELLGQINFLPLSDAVLARALEPFPVPLRTLDALHLASAHHLHTQGYTVELASYDARLLRAAAALGIPAYEL